MNKHMCLPDAVRFAYFRGYRVTADGILIGLKKKPLIIRLRGKQNYPQFTINISGVVQSIPIHKLAAYCFYGEQSLVIGVVVRHVNRKRILDVSKRNIKIGSHSQNNMDKPKHLRVMAAKRARASQPREGTTAKLTDNIIIKIRKFYSKFKGRKPPNGSVSAMAADLGVHRNALACVKSGATWSYVK